MDEKKSGVAEPGAFGRLIIRSALLGAFVPVESGEFWSVKLIQVISAIVLCLVLYGLERAILGKRFSIKPLHLAAYRGAALYSLLSFIFDPADVAQALGGAVGGALAAMLLFALETGILKLVSKRKSTDSAADSPSD